MASLCVEVVSKYHISSSPMIAYSFVKPLRVSVIACLIFWPSMRLPPAKPLIAKRHPFSLAEILDMQWRRRFVAWWERKLWLATRNIWGCRWLRECPKCPHSKRYRRKSLKGSWGGRRSIFQRHVGKCWSNLSPKQFPPTRWVSSKSPNNLWWY